MFFRKSDDSRRPSLRLPMFRTFLRSFLLQASWNFERLQNLGFLFMMLPGLRTIYRAGIPEDVLDRHKQYFNAHPFFAPMIAGATLRLEASLATKGNDQVDISAFKQMVMAPLAAIGDSLFWGGIRPLASIIALFMALHGSLWAPVIFLALFNLPHFLCRGGGLMLGYLGGLSAIETIQRFHLPDLSVRCKEGSIILLGVLCAFLAHKGCSLQEIPPFWGFVVLPVVLLFARLARQGISSLFLILVTTTSLLGFALVF